MALPSPDAPPENILTISDFSPGIFSTFGNAAGPAPLGAAQETGTYGCIALPGGGLGPLPTYSVVATSAFTDASQAGATTAVAIAGLGATYEINTHVLFHVPSVNKYYMTKLVAGVLSIVQFQSTDAVAYNYAEMAGYVTTPYGTDINYGVSAVNDKLSHIVHGRLTLPISGVQPHCSYFEFDGVTGRFRALYPARVIGQAFGFGQRNNSISGVQDQTKILYTAPAALPNPLTGQLNLCGFLAGDTYGVISTGEFFIVSRGRGALRISGSFEYPTVTELPGVVSTGYESMRAVPTSIGLLYGVRRRGVFSWNGSNISEFVSPQLRSDFFNRITPTSDTSGGQTIQATAWRGYAVFPNGFLFSPEQKSWWKLSAPAEITGAVYWTDLYGDLFAVPNTVTIASGTAVVKYDSTTQRSNYSWQSHSIPVSPHGRMVEVHDIELRVTPSAVETQTVIVTLTNSEGVEVSETFLVRAESTRHPVRMRMTTFSRGYDVVVGVFASSGSANPAPIVHSVSLAWRSV